MINYWKYQDVWGDVKGAARTTVGREGNGLPPDIRWKKSILLAEHSPIRLIKFKWKWQSLKSWVSVHIVRHKFGIEHWVTTQRSDRTGVDRDASRQDAPVNHMCEADAQALINNAIITNCRTPVYTAQYHLFGDWNIYRQTHFCLDQAMAVNREEAEKDSLFFHDADWNADADLIFAADRIIFCFDDEKENVQCAQMLDDCFSHNAKIYVRSSCPFMPGVRFGETGELYTEELVMKHRLDRLAMGLHNRYCSKTEKQMPAWEELSIFMKESNRAAADHIPTKISLLLDAVQPLDQERCRMAAKAFHEADDSIREKCRQNEHDRWMRFYCLHNWRYASERDDSRRMHPCILPYEQLSDEEKAKDDYAWQLLAECAEIQELL